MNRTVLLDTGPLVALVNRRDRYHEWSVQQVADLQPPLLTCEAVLAESSYLLRNVHQGVDLIFRLIQRGLVTIPFRLAEETSRVVRLLQRYADVPMSLADACLVRMAEQHDGSAVVTLDSDFRIYRKNGRQIVPTIMPNQAW